MMLLQCIVLPPNVGDVFFDFIQIDLVQLTTGDAGRTDD